jgi:hypothetical protein
MIDERWLLAESIGQSLIRSSIIHFPIKSSLIDHAVIHDRHAVIYPCEALAARIELSKTEMACQAVVHHGTEPGCAVQWRLHARWKQESRENGNSTAVRDSRAAHMEFDQSKMAPAQRIWFVCSENGSCAANIAAAESNMARMQPK